MLHRFLDFELDEELFELRSRGEVIATQARVFEFIRHVLHNRERVVSKQELISALWKGAIVSDTAISQVVMLARKALRDEGETQHIIRTVRGRGFRFVAELDGGARGARGTARDESMVPAPVATGSNSDARPALFGRAAELAQLGGRFARAQRGQGGLVLIDGEPGIGKSTLASEFAAQAASQGAAVIWGRAWEEGGAPPFWPWIQVLRALSQRHGSQRLREALGRSGHELVALMPDLADGSVPDAAQELDGPRARFRQFDAIARLLRALHGARELGPAAQQAVCVIVLDDLHAVDDASLQLLRFLAPDLSELALLIVGTFRDIALVPGSALSALAETCSDSEQRLRLRGIAPADATLLLERNLGRAPSQHDSAALYELSGGNPLLLAALCQRIEASQGLDVSQLSGFSLPERMANAVHRHTAELPSDTRELLSVASAFGREFPLQTLAQLRCVGESELLELLEPARRRGIVRVLSAGGTQLSFSHALVCNAIYSELSAARRLELHHTIAELLEASAPPERLPLYELAHHYGRAAADGCREKAIEFAERAAAEAAGMMAYEVAAGLYERAFQLAHLEGVDGERLHGLLCRTGESWYRAGELERAAASFDRAADLGRSEQNAERFAWGTVLSATTLRGTVLHDRSRHVKLKQALLMLPEGDSEIRALTLAASMLGTYSASSLPERQAAVEAAVAMARRLGNPMVLQWTLNAQHLTLWGAAPPEQLISVASEMLELARRTGDHEVMLDGMLWRMADCGELGDSERAVRWLSEYRDYAEQLGSPWHRYMALGAELYHVFAQGDYERAAVMSDQVLKQGLRVGESLAEGFHAVRSLFLWLQRGEPLVAAPSVEAPSSVPPDYRAFWSLAALRLGRPELARATLLSVLASDFDGSVVYPLRRPLLATMAQVAVTLGDRSCARQIYERLQPDLGRHMNMQAWVYLGPVSYYLGLLAATLQEAERACEYFERALSESALAPPFQAYVHFAYGRQLQQLGAREGAQLQLGAARQIATALGMAPLCAQLGNAPAETESGLEL